MTSTAVSQPPKASFGAPETMYCAEQIKIPPALPEILKNYTKFVLKTQPTDILTASAEYVTRISLLSLSMSLLDILANWPSKMTSLEAPETENLQINSSKLSIERYMHPAFGSDRASSSPPPH